MIGVRFWDFRGDYVNLSVGYNESACDSGDLRLSSLKYLINPSKVTLSGGFQAAGAK